jgi:hypothetical protein
MIVFIAPHFLAPQNANSRETNDDEIGLLTEKL